MRPDYQDIKTPFAPERNSLYVGATLSQSLRDRVADIVVSDSGEPNALEATVYS